MHKTILDCLKYAEFIQHKVNSHIVSVKGHDYNHHHPLSKMLYSCSKSVNYRRFLRKSPIHKRLSYIPNILSLEWQEMGEGL